MTGFAQPDQKFYQQLAQGIGESTPRENALQASEAQSKRNRRSHSVSRRDKSKSFIAPTNPFIAAQDNSLGLGFASLKVDAAGNPGKKSDVLIQFAIEKTELISVKKRPSLEDFSCSSQALEFRDAGKQVHLCPDFEKEKVEGNTFTVSWSRVVQTGVGLLRPNLHTDF